LYLQNGLDIEVYDLRPTDLHYYYYPHRSPVVDVIDTLLVCKDVARYDVCFSSFSLFLSIFRRN